MSSDSAIEKLLSQPSMALGMGELSEQEYAWAQDQGRQTLWLVRDYGWNIVDAEGRPPLFMRMAMVLDETLGCKKMDQNLAEDRKIDTVLRLAVEAHPIIARMGQYRLDSKIIEQGVEQARMRAQLQAQEQEYEHEVLTRTAASRYVLTNFARYGAMALPNEPQETLVKELAELIGSKKPNQGMDVLRKEAIGLYREVCGDGKFRAPRLKPIEELIQEQEKRPRKPSGP